MSACNNGGHYDHTLALLDAVARRAQDTLASDDGSKDPKVTGGLSGNSTGPVAGDTEKKGEADARGRLPPTPEVFTLALEACAGRMRQNKAANAEQLSRQIILLMQVRCLVQAPSFSILLWRTSLPIIPTVSDRRSHARELAASMCRS